MTPQILKVSFLLTILFVLTLNLKVPDHGLDDHQVESQNASNNVHETIENQHDQSNQRRCAKDSKGVRREWSE